MNNGRAEINILTSVHRAVDTRIFHKQAASLARAGHLVRLFAQEHPEASTIAQQYNIQYIPLLRIDKRFERGKVWLNLMNLLKQMPGDIWHFHDPELLPWTIIWKKMFAQHVSLIYDVHEDMPLQTLSKEWIPEFLRKPTSWAAGIVEKNLSTYTQAIVTATPDIANNFAHDNKVVIHNYPFLPKHSKQLDNVPYLERDPIVAYTGGLTKMQGIFEMLDAMNLLPEALNVKFHIAGKHDPLDLMDRLVVTPGWKHVHYHGVISRDEVVNLMNKAKVGLVIDHPIPNYLRSLSTKMFEYMSAGIPIVASNFPLWESIINKHQCGIVVNPYDPQAVTNAITWLLENPEEAMAMGKRGQRAILEKYNWEKEASTLLGFYETILSR